MEFACCKKTTSDAYDPLICSSCRQCFHVACVLPSRSSEWEPDDDLKLTWRCPACCGTSPRGNNDDTPCRITKRSKKKCEKVTSIATVKAAEIVQGAAIPMSAQITIDEIRSIIKAEISQAFSAFQNNFDDIKAEISTLHNSLQFISDNYDRITKKVDNLETKIKLLDSVKSDFSDMKRVVSSLESDLNNKEQWARRSNIEIIGVPETKNENLLNIITKISCAANINTLTESDIDFVTRVTPKQNNSNKPRPIIVRFLARYKKDNFLARVREKSLICGDIGYNGNNNRVYFNDHLTSFNKTLLRKTKDLAKEKNYRFVWVKNCSVMARKNDTSPVLHIHSESDLKKML